MNVVTTIIFMTFIIMVAQRWHQYESIPSEGQEMLSGKFFMVIIISLVGVVQGCISCGILVSGIGARGVSSEHMENMEMFSCSPT